MAGSRAMVYHIDPSPSLPDPSSGICADAPVIGLCGFALKPASAQKPGLSARKPKIGMGNRLLGKSPDRLGLSGKHLDECNLVDVSLDPPGGNTYYLASRGL